jgi:N-methylhydantoinase A
MNIVGVDIGGTFTDLVGVIDGEVVTSKTSTVPADPTAGVAESLRLAHCHPRRLAEVLHGSTIAINTVLERKGAQTALLTTRGFRDVYGIGRSNRIEAFNLFFHRPKPLARREMTFEVDERLNAAGEVIVALDEKQVEAIARQLRERGVEAVAVCFLHSYSNPAHERLAGEVLRRFNPDMFVTLSHEILREFREYERTSTTVLNAYVGPRVRDYLGTLESYLRRESFGGKVHMMRSNGGVMSIRKAQEEPVSMMESGPVAGMIGAGRLASHLGIARCIGFDMGGTTAKASLITDGMPAVEEGYVIGTAASGQPMQLPVVDIVEVGAGGGSIAWVDHTGGLHVGPKSAGADPGPACYRRGGERPTVTDADLACGFLNPDYFLGGAQKLDLAAAETALQRHVAEPLNMGVIDAAAGIRRIVDIRMADEVRVFAAKRGVDLASFTLLPFGGAGAVHAAAVAEELGMRRILVPPRPGAFSALGLLCTDVVHDYVRSELRPLSDVTADHAEATFAGLEAKARGELAEEGMNAADAGWWRELDLRYAGQGYELRTPLHGLYVGRIDAATLEQARHRFDERHAQIHGHAAKDRPVEVVSYRLRVRVAVPKYEPHAEPPSAPGQGAPDRKGERTVYFDGATGMPAALYERNALDVGMTLAGPAIIEQFDATTVIPALWRAEVDRYRNLILTRREA